MGLTSLAFLIAYFAGCIFAFTRHPIWGLVTYVGAFYLHPPSRWWGEALPDLRWSLTAAAVTAISVLMFKQPRQRRPSVFKHPVVFGYIAYLVWCIVQSPFALDPEMHRELIILYVKYIVLIVLIRKCIDSEENVRIFLWAHVAGCFYMGWIAYSSYQGGRFEGFGGPDINEANAGALQIVTGIFSASVLFLAGSVRAKAILVGMMPFIVNALVATVSRGAFLAAAIGGLLFNVYTPGVYRKRVRVLSGLAVVLFILLTNPLYWARMASLKHAGEEVEGQDTGSGRLVIIEAQWKMFLDHPLGCGHRCTAALSRFYLDDKYLTTSGETRARSSHNTTMTMLVEHGILGGIFYGLLVLWLFRSVRELARRSKGQNGFIPTLMPGMAAILSAIILGDVFVDYLKFEARLWFVSLLIVLLDLSAPAAPGGVGGPGNGRKPVPGLKLRK